MKGFLSGVWAGDRKAGNYWLANLSSLSGRAEVISERRFLQPFILRSK